MPRAEWGHGATTRVSLASRGEHGLRDRRFGTAAECAGKHYRITNFRDRVFFLSSVILSPAPRAISYRRDFITQKKRIDCYLRRSERKEPLKTGYFARRPYCLFCLGNSKKYIYICQVRAIPFCRNAADSKFTFFNWLNLASLRWQYVL